MTGTLTPLDTCASVAHQRHSHRLFNPGAEGARIEKYGGEICCLSFIVSSVVVATATPRSL